MEINNTNETKSIQINQIAMELTDTEQIMSTIQAQKHKILEVKSDALYPRTVTEKKLAEIWEETFGLEKISINENFFDLGGDSLLGVQILSRAQEVFQVELSLDTLFTTEITIVELATIIEQQQIEQAKKEEILSILQEMDNLSDEEVKELLNNEMSNS